MSPLTFPIIKSAFLESLRRPLRLFRSESVALVGRQRAETFLIALMIVAYSLLQSVAPVGIRMMVNSITHRDTGGAIYGVVFFCITIGISRLSNAWALLRFGYLQKKVRRLLGKTLHEKIVHLPMDVLARYRSGEISKRISDSLSGIRILLSTVYFGLIPPLVQGAVAIVVLLLTIKVTFVFEMILLSIMCASSALIGIRRRQKLLKRAMQAEAKSSAIATEMLLGSDALKIFEARAYATCRLDAALALEEDIWGEFFRNRACSSGAAAVALSASVATILLTCIYRVSLGQLNIGDVVLIYTYMFQLIRPFMTLGASTQGFSQGLAQIEWVREILKIPSENTGGIELLRKECGIHLECRNMSFGYSKERLILKGVSFRIRSGSKLGIVGGNGSGKSTLIRVLTKLHGHYLGEIQADGIELAVLSPSSWRLQVACVTQETMLFDGTILDNVVLGRRHVKEEHVQDAFKVSGLDEVVRRLPDGVGTQVGQMGCQLSGGERQRIGIARALVGKPRLAVFDEATSALDTLGEKEVLSSLRQHLSGISQLIVAHRLRSVVDCDEILVMESGEVVERGSHGELMDLEGIYSAMWKQQCRSPESSQNYNGSSMHGVSAALLR